MPKKKSPDLSLPSSWKDLVQKKSRRTASRSSVRKRWQMGLKLLSLILILSVVGAFGLFTEKNFSSSLVGSFEFKGVSPMVDRVRFSSDGALNHKWFANWFGPIRKRTLMDLNLADIHQHLLGEHQIANAKIRRVFPSTLEVTIQERQPVLVLRLKDRKKGYQDWLVSRDGTLYLGQEYSSSRLALLPSLRIAPNQLKRKVDGSGYAALTGMVRVSPLLELARREYPDLYRDWRVVSYERPDDLDPGAHILVQSGRIGKIRFSPNAYADQMKRLRYLLKDPKFSKTAKIRSIDLSHERSVFAKI